MESRTRAASLAPVAFLIAYLVPCLPLGRGYAFADTQVAPPPPTPSAVTQAPPPPLTGRAAELKKRGDDAMQSLAYAEALAAYTEAYALAPDPALLYNRGMALRAIGAYPEALSEFEKFARTARPELRARVPHLDELIADVRARVATLRVVCNVAGARVLVREKIAGTTPMEQPLVLASGPAVVEVTAEGYSAFHREIELVGQATFDLAVTLAPRERTGVLAVTTTPVGAAVFVDGRSLGPSPTEGPVAPGAHTVRVRMDSYDDAESSVVVAAAARKEVFLELHGHSAITGRVWFWAGLGALVVGGTAITVALLTEKKAPSGDIAPGQVTAPLVRF